MIIGNSSQKIQLLFVTCNVRYHSLICNFFTLFATKPFIGITNTRLPPLLTLPDLALAKGVIWPSGFEKGMTKGY